MKYKFNNVGGVTVPFIDRVKIYLGIVEDVYYRARAEELRNSWLDSVVVDVKKLLDDHGVEYSATNLDKAVRHLIIDAIERSSIDFLWDCDDIKGRGLPELAAIAREFSENTIALYDVITDKVVRHLDEKNYLPSKWFVFDRKRKVSCIQQSIESTLVMGGFDVEVLSRDNKIDDFSSALANKLIPYIGKSRQLSVDFVCDRSEGFRQYANQRKDGLNSLWESFREASPPQYPPRKNTAEVSEPSRQINQDSIALVMHLPLPNSRTAARVRPYEVSESSSQIDQNSITWVTHLPLPNSRRGARVTPSDTRGMGGR